MRMLALLLLLGNVGFFAWQQHWLPWLPWQPEAFKTDATAQAAQANSHLMPVILVSEYDPSELESPLIVAEANSSSIAMPDSDTAAPVATQPPVSSVEETDSTPPPAEEATTAPSETVAAAETNMPSLTEPPPHLSEPDRIFLERTFSRLAERLSDPKVAAEIPADNAPSEEGPQPLAAAETTPITEEAETAADDSFIAALTMDDAPLVAATDTSSTSDSMHSATEANEEQAAPRLVAANAEDSGTELTALNTETPTPLSSVLPQETAQPPRSAEPPAPVTSSPPQPTPAPKVTTPPKPTPVAPKPVAPPPAPTTPPVQPVIVPQVTRTTGNVCYQIGPYTQAASAQAAAHWFNQYNPNSANWEQRVNRLLNTTRVYLPPYANQQAALAAQRELQQRGIQDHFVLTEGPLRHAISLGVYRDLLSVERRLRELQQAGYHTVRTAQTHNNTVRYWVYLNLPARRRALVGQFTQRFTVSQVQVVNCR